MVIFVSNLTTVKVELGFDNLVLSFFTSGWLVILNFTKPSHPPLNVSATASPGECISFLSDETFHSKKI